jgi:NTE family protein
LKNVASSPFPDRLAYRQFQDYNTFTDPNRKYLHLLDGGLADNLGLRSIYEGLRNAPAALPISALLNLGEISNMLVIIVNARTGDKSITPSNRALGPLTPQVVLGATSGIPMGTVTYDSVDMLTEFLDATRQAQRDQPGLFRTKIFAVELTFDTIGDEPTRRFFKGLPTDFALPPTIVDCLISQGKRLLVDSWSYGGAAEPFGEYVRQTLNGAIPPLSDHVVIKGKNCTVAPGQP